MLASRTSEGNATTTSGISRREAIKLALGAFTCTALGCSLDALGAPGSPRLTARPGVPSKPVGPGLHSFNLSFGRRALLYVPPGYNVATPAPFVLMFHGAGINADGPINLFRTWADGAGLILLSCDSLGATWDAIHGDYGIDIAHVDQALKRAFDMCAADPTRVGVEGFSDGATYAIGVGRSNGDLFSRVVAFSAGFLLRTIDTGKPEFFVSHGTGDPVLPIDVSGRPIMNALRQLGYTVDYREFDGGHNVPPDIASTAVTWLAAARTISQPAGSFEDAFSLSAAPV